MRNIIWLGSAAVALMLIVAVAALGLRGTTPSETPVPPPAAAPPSSSPPAQAIAPPKASLPAPSFDVVTVDPEGQAVIAGRAAPGDRVRVLDGDSEIGAVTADARGEWVLLPKQPMAAGNRQLSLEATAPGGGAARASHDVVALSVTPHGDKTAAALAVLLPGDQGRPARILQAPGVPTPASSLSLDSAEYGAGARLALAGHADPGAHLSIYFGDRLLGAATADADGKWSLSAAPPTSAAGSSELRVDEVDAGGIVARRIAVPYEPAGTPPGGAGTYIVQRGNSLWLIARQVYGQGVRYTAIYSANRDQIRDPDRIYPGQQFKLPPHS